MSTLKEVSFKVRSNLKEIDRLLYQFEQVKQPWIPRKDWLQCQLALAEGFTNAVRHAHKDLPPEIPIEVEIRLNRDSMEIRIWDCGPPFDLENFLHQPVSQDNRLAERGQGLPILQKIAARLSYRRTPDHRNCLSILKEFSPA